MLTSFSTNSAASLADRASDASAEGIGAFSAGLTAEANPYREGTSLWFCWRDGWEKAESWEAAASTKRGVL